jgi:hypothetical protein
MNTNQSNDLSSAESQANQHRQSLEQTLAGLNDEASRYAMQRYDAAVAAEEEQRRWEAEMAEKRRQFNEQMAQQRAYQSYLNQAGNSSNNLKSWNFGNGYQLVQNPNGAAEYYNNGTRVSAYDFLMGTGGGSNWDKWNDVWNNGVSTTGVGSDTISGINSFLNTGNYSDKYNYLRGL